MRDWRSFELAEAVVVCGVYVRLSAAGRMPERPFDALEEALWLAWTWTRDECDDDYWRARMRAPSRQQA